MHREMDLIRFLTCEQWERKQYLPTIDQVDKVRIVASSTNFYLISSLTISLRFADDKSFSKEAISLVEQLLEDPNHSPIYPRVYQRRGSVLFIYVD